MELELETASRDVQAPMPENMTNEELDAFLKKNVDWDSMICESCQ